MHRKTRAQLLGAAMVLVLSATASAQDTGIPSNQLIALAASMNGMAVACKEHTQAEVDALYIKQRQAQLSPQMTAAHYDKAYATAFAAFKTKWDSVDSATQQKQCAQLKAMSQQAAATAKQLEAQMGKK